VLKERNGALGRSEAVLVDREFRGLRTVSRDAVGARFLRFFQKDARYLFAGMHELLLTMNLHPSARYGMALGAGAWSCQSVLLACHKPPGQDKSTSLSYYPRRFPFTVLDRQQ
jgi:hypothetical protein